MGRLQEIWQYLKKFTSENVHDQAYNFGIM